jgi:molecular chaperone Hsp33
MSAVQLNTDVVLGVDIPSRNARGRIARLGPVVDSILASHHYPPLVEKLLAEALTLTALLGSLLKEPQGQLTLQAQTEGGAIDLLVCDFLGGELRGYVQFDEERLAQMPADPTLFALFGKGYLAITFDQALTGERYQGIVPLEGASLAEAAQSYFAQSEQIPSLVRLAHRHDTDGRVIAGGMLLQHLPEGEEGRDRLHTRLDHPEWQHVEALGRTIKDEELVDPALPMETLVWRLFHDEKEVRVLGGAALTRGCRCNREHILGVLSRFPVEEQQNMADAEGLIRVDCAFCSISHPVRLEELRSAA